MNLLKQKCIRVQLFAVVAVEAIVAYEDLIAVKAAATGSVPARINGTDDDPTARFDWWQGDFSSMSKRRTRALTSSRVVLCYVRRNGEGGGCRIAAGVLDKNPLANADQALGPEETATLSGGNWSYEPIANDPRMLPTLSWGTEWVPETDGNYTRLEVERLTDELFVVCFQCRPVEGGRTICTIGSVVSDEGGSHAKIKTYGMPLDVDAVRLVAVQPGQTGKRFAVCYQKAGTQATDLIKGTTVCKWAECEEGSNSGFLWITEKPIEVKFAKQNAIEPGPNKDEEVVLEPTAVTSNASAAFKPANSADDADTVAGPETPSDDGVVAAQSGIQTMSESASVLTDAKVAVEERPDPGIVAGSRAEAPETS